ncbi:helix-turn-helix domain-containing protein [Flavicella sediminum]|uniref:helix-turn-helix domain-containing protein n=1 Tax=Flavicella sediminum TaxID=2585141 RepID=UPI00112474D2|nr:helix-turn-helix domain-containing protein [Flavicella sediminum]
MTSKTDNNIIKEALDKLCAHPLFVNSSVYTRLLTYLVEKAIQKEDIKEYTIGADLFGKNYLSDKNDGTVRTYMYKLRKKLAAYYADQTIENEIIFEIKKGQYNLEFITKEKFKKDKFSPTIQILLKYIKSVNFLFLFAILLFFGIKAYLNQPPAMWGNFFKSSSNNLVVMSDHYVLMAKNQYGEEHATIYGKINNGADFLKFKKEHPDRSIKTTDFTLLSKMAPYSIYTLSEWFLGMNTHFKLQLESQLTLNEIKQHNIIFIGQHKTMNISSSFFLKDSKMFSIYKDGFKYEFEGQEKIYNTKHESKGKVEYAMVSFVSISPEKEAIYFVSNNDIGVMATLRNFTNKDWLKTFGSKLPNKKNKFNALFEVSGLQRTDMSCKLVALEILDK